MRATLPQPLQIARGAVYRLDERVREVGQPGLTIWTEAATTALAEHAAQQVRLVESLRRALGELSAGPQLRRGELFSVIERANAAVRGAIESAGLLCLALVFVFSVITSGASDGDLARRVRQRSAVKRRTDAVYLADGETGEVQS